MTATPGSRTPLVLAHSLLSSFLVARPEQCDHDDICFFLDFLRYRAHHN